ncbi:MAG: GNAT family N-acetyltransferase [Gaiellaceae bacterium]
MSLTIREAGQADAAFLAELVGRLGYPAPEDAMPARMEQLERDGQSLFVAELDGEAAGMAVMQICPVLIHDTPTCRLAVLVVAERAERRGVGRALTLAVEEAARRAACDRIVLESGVWRDGAHGFYRALGYESIALGFQKRL